MTAPRSLAPAAVDPKTGRVAVVRVGRVEIQSADDATEPTFVELGGVDAISWTVSGKLFAVTRTGVHLLDVESGGAARLCDHGLGGATAIAVDRSERIIALGRGPDLVLCDLDDFTRRGRASYGSRDVAALGFDADGRLCIALDDGEVVRRDVTAPRPSLPERPAEPPLVPEGPRLRWGSGGLLTVGGALFGLLVLMLPWGPRAGVVLGALATLVTATGVLQLLGSFDDAHERAPVPVGRLAAPLGHLGGAAIFLWLVLRLAVQGAIGPSAAAVLVPIATLSVVVTGARLLTAIGALSTERPLHHREGFWVVTFATIVLLPALGAHGLTDPWETHYGEVSREILAREDWISLWWAQEDWFFSKPVLDFWLQALSMAVLGVRYEPGQMLAAAGHGASPAPEWAVRWPIFVLTLVATYLVYKSTARTFGRRAGLLSSVVLTTMPAWFFLSHQTMTDMPFVATMASGIALFLMGASEDPERRLAVFPVRVGSRVFGLSAHQLAAGALLAVTLPQILYLVTRNLQLNLDPVFGLRVPPVHFVRETFAFGSADNCGLVPGNSPCSRHTPVHGGFHPALQAILWVQPLALALYLLWGERRAQRLYFVGGFFFIALSSLAKGPAGVVVPLVAVLAYVVATRRFHLLLRMELATGILMLVAIVMPWFVAMFVRHGQKFTDRLLFHDMLKRALEHVHDTNRRDDTSFRYYVWQLGYATFPWVGLLPPALVSLLGGGTNRPGPVTREREDARGAIALHLTWLVAGFALFSLMPTKFHHYIFPVVPPLAVLLGVWLDRALGTLAPLAPWRALVATLAGPGAALIYFGGRGSLVAFGLAAIFGLAATWWASMPSGADGGARAFESALATVTAILGAGLVFLVGRDLAVPRPDQPTNARLLQLFTYNYEREWPKSLDFSGALLAFTVAATLLLALASWDRTRRAAAVGFVTVAAAFSTWGLDVYFVRASPHWGQRELVLTYVRESVGSPGPLVAYEMNWKGENFYTGNRVAAFVESGKPFRDWLAKQRKQGQKTFYFVLLPGRRGALESQLGRARAIEQLSTETDNNKFVLLRADLD